MKRIFLTNDDSHRSPLLEIVIEAARNFGELTIVVPKEEQSWKGKSTTRFEPLHLETCTLFGHPAHTLSGTPADCSAVGLYHLFDDLPDLVVSGINAGLNTGAGFAFSSGTIGACLEANIAGIPAIAISQQFDNDTSNQYVATYALPTGIADKFRRQSRGRLELLFDALLNRSPLSSEPITWNVNFPFDLGDDAPFAMSPLGHTWYGNCFVEDGGAPVNPKGLRTFRHKVGDIRFDPRPESDNNQLLSGCVPITPLDMRQFGQGHPLGTQLMGELLKRHGAR